jgi:hypothetical protein
MHGRPTHAAIRSIGPRLMALRAMSSSNSTWGSATYIAIVVSKRLLESTNASQGSR